MAGIYHDYYTVALAPAIGGAVADRRRGPVGQPADARGHGYCSAATSIGTGVWALVLLMQAGSWYTYLGWGVFGVATAAGIGDDLGRPAAEGNRRSHPGRGARRRAGRTAGLLDQHCVHRAHRLDPDGRPRDQHGTRRLRRRRTGPVAPVAAGSLRPRTRARPPAARVRPAPRRRPGRHGRWRQHGRPDQRRERVERTGRSPAGGRLVLHLGGGKRRARRTRRATSWRPGSR